MGTASECGHEVPHNKPVKRCRACWADRQTDGQPRKTYTARICGHETQNGNGADYCRACFKATKGGTVDPSLPPVEADLAHARAKREDRSLKARYAEALARIERLEQTVEASAGLSATPSTITIEPVKASGTSEATAVWVASDWHIEERVGPEVGDLNRYSLTIAEARVKAFFSHALRLTHILGQDVTISTVILALLGDFITNDIHEELVEQNALSPIEALSTAQAWIISGIEFVLKSTTHKLVIPCHSGNHARTTKTTRFGTENGHSLETLMFKHLAAYFRHEPRVTFLIAEGMHSYVTVYDQVVRFQHGHAIKYGGGVGGIYIPVHKAIANWDRAKRADLNVFGHFHQLVDGGNFICNGSIIGYNSFALSIKAPYEKPRQALFLLDKKRGRTFNCPILV